MGGCSLEAAEAVCACEDIESGAVLELLSSLVDKSLLIVREHEGEARYRLLETVRQYGREKLEEEGEAQAVRGRHAGFFLDLAEEAEPEINGAQRRLWLERLEAEHDNLRAALSWAIESQESETGLRLAGALWYYWQHSGRLSEGRRWLREALSLGGGGATASRAKALGAAGYLAWFAQGDLDAARSQLEESVEIYRELQDKRGLAYALQYLPVVMAYQGDFEPALTLGEESVRLFREVGDRWGLGMALNHLGHVPEAQDDHALANRVFGESATILREVGDEWALSLPLRHLGIVASRQGDYALAEELHKESLALSRRAGEKWVISLCLEELAGVARLRGDLARAARLWGVAETLRETVGASGRALYRAEYDRGVTAARTGLGEEAFTEAWAEGREMTIDETLDYALENTPEVKAAPATGYPAGLTAREVEVLRLVAGGMSNTQVAQELYLSPRTVSTHLSSIYHKLEVTSRAAAVRFASEHNLL